MLFAHPQHHCRFPLPRFFCPVTMHSSGENSRKRKNDSAKRGEYRNFDQMSSQMRDTLIESYAEKVIAHAAENGGRCRLGFVKELVGMVSQRAPLLEITRDDINNRVRIIKGQRKEEEQRDVSPAIPFHIIRDPSLSTNSDLSVSASSNEQHSWYKVDSPLVGYRWFRNFCKRNPEIWTKKSQKYARNREDHCNYAAFIKMYAQCEDGLVA